MASVLVHITHGPEHPTRSALGFLVARSAVEEGHEVTLFLAGDAVQLLRAPVIENLGGLGTGKLAEHFQVLKGAGCKFYLSGMSSKSRGLSEDDLTGVDSQMATPRDLVKLSLEHDRMFVY